MMSILKELKSNRLKKLRIAFFIMLIITLIGTFGFISIEHQSFLDSLYMTVITVSTVGYKEAFELSMTGRIFTLFLIIISWVAFAYAVSVITTYFLEGEINNILRNYQKKSVLRKMKNHIIIIGYGRNGRQTAHDLLQSHQDFIVVDRDHQLILEEKDDKSRFYEGDATKDSTMLDVGIKKARALVTTLPTDADNLFVVLTARSLNPDIYIVSRASNESTERKLEMAGVNKVIMPEKVGGSHMASLVTKPDLVEFLQQISLKGEHETNLEELMCSNLREEKKETTIGSLNIRSLSGANIVGFKTPEGKYIINPSPKTKMVPNAKLFVMGTPEQIDKMKLLMKNDKA
ncbi:MAG: potassium channel protein [Bacteroidales bacterium]|nr:potassium channel protein [Bacteroidales bacterium]